MSEKIEDTLKERGSNYGRFSDQALIVQNIKAILSGALNWNKCSPSQREALEMIAHKMARIVNGNPNYDDSWRDISGYAELVVKQLNGEDL